MPPPAPSAADKPPVFGFLAFTSGSYEGAIIRDMRLANALHRRGHRVVIHWMMERNPELADRGIPQRLLCRGLRYRFSRPSRLMDALAAPAFALPAKMRREYVQRHPALADAILGNFVRCVCRGGASDPGLVRRLARAIAADGVTHLLPTFAMLCPFALEAKRLAAAAGAACGPKFDYLATFQGEEIFANYAERAGLLRDYHVRLQEAVAGSPWPAVAVSRDYIDRLHDEMGIPADRLRAIYPGIELPKSPPPPFETLRTKFPEIRQDLPILAYVGRQDAEKGIDLLLYAARMLLSKGLKFQLVICGGTSFGQRYRDVLMQVAQHLRVPTMHRRRIPSDVRDALYAHARCIVYPSIHREPFGMVAAEAMSFGTPVVVPALGGITEAVSVEGRSGGLTFAPWDSADLARALERMLTDEALYAGLKSDTRHLAERFTVDRMTDRVLEHLGLVAPTLGGSQ